MPSYLAGAAVSTASRSSLACPLHLHSVCIALRPTGWGPLAILCLFWLIPYPARGQFADQPVKLTGHQRSRDYLVSLVSPVPVLGSVASAGIGQWRDHPSEWKEGAAGYGRRFASSMAQHVAAQTMLSGAAAVLKEDNRYRRSGQFGVRRRLKYALIRTVLARAPDGSRHVSFSKLGSFAGAAFISRAWQPPSSAAPQNALANIGASLGAAAGFNVLREFLPRRYHPGLLGPN